MPVQNKIRGHFMYIELSFRHYLKYYSETVRTTEIYCACGFIGKYGVILYQQLMSKVISINGKSCFDQWLVTISSSKQKLSQLTRLSIQDCLSVPFHFKVDV